jgi:hypothetical protein
MSGPRDFDEAEQWIRQDSNDIGRLEAENAQLRHELDEARGALFDLEAWAAYHSGSNTTLLNAALEKARAIKQAAKKD